MIKVERYVRPALLLAGNVDWAEDRNREDVDEFVEEGYKVSQADRCASHHHKQHTVGGKNEGAGNIATALMNSRLF